jgi:hypothetical protein
VAAWTTTIPATHCIAAVGVSLKDHGIAADARADHFGVGRKAGGIRTSASNFVRTGDGAAMIPSISAQHAAQRQESECIRIAASAEAAIFSDSLTR